MKFWALLLIICQPFTSLAATSGASQSSTQSSQIYSSGMVSIKNTVRFDGHRLRDKYVRKFARGKLLTWALCDEAARDNGDCSFYLVEQRTSGAQNVLFMSEQTCEDNSAGNCRNGYLVTMRSRATYQYRESTESVSFTQKLYRTLKLPLYNLESEAQTPAEVFIGSIEGNIGRYSYELFSYDSDGHYFDEMAASITALEAEFADNCTVAWEAGLAGAGVLGGMAGATTAAAAGYAMSGMLVSLSAASGSILGSAAIIGVGYFAAPLILGAAVGITTAAVTVGAVSVAINHWCQPSQGAPNPPSVPGFPDGFIPSPANTCGDDYIYTEYCWDCSYDVVTFTPGEDGTEEVDVAHEDQECCQWGCLPISQI